ncbi:MAG TPA: hypothetical protein VIG99_11935 [Myxococcaceae bacterium]
MTRKEFLKGAALTVVAVGCGGGASPTDCGITIDVNHGHTLTVPKADASAGGDKTYHIKGGADHDHTVTITAAQFASLRVGTEVTITSSPDIGLNTHDHGVTVNCA